MRDAVGPHVSRDWAAKGDPLDAHVSEALRAARRNAGFRVGAAAVFVSNPRGLKLALSPAEAAGLRALRDDGLRLLAHSSYAAFPWKAGGSGDAGARHIRAELLACASAGIEGLVVHLPAAPPEAVLARAPDLLVPEAAAAGVRLLFETPATVGAASTFYETPRRLASLFASLASLRGDAFGLCVDSAHLWTNGVDLAGFAPAEAWLADLGARVPLDRLAFHLNDSLRARGVGPDAHSPFATGKIWGDCATSSPGVCGLAAFADFASRSGAPFILERSSRDPSHLSLFGDFRVLGALGLGRGAEGAGGGGGAGAGGAFPPAE